MPPGTWSIPGGVDVMCIWNCHSVAAVSSDDWNTGTRAAARGGVTTVIDFAIPYGTETLTDAYENWMAQAKPKACVDYCFHITITKLGPGPAPKWKRWSPWAARRSKNS